MGGKKKFCVSDRVEDMREMGWNGRKVLTPPPLPLLAHIRTAYTALGKLLATGGREKVVEVPKGMGCRDRWGTSAK